MTKTPLKMCSNPNKIRAPGTTPPPGPNSGFWRKIYESKDPEKIIQQYLNGVTDRQYTLAQVTPDQYKKRLYNRVDATLKMLQRVNSKQTANSEKHQLRCQHVYDYGKLLFHCDGCWMMPAKCVCGDFRRGLETKFADVVVHMHWSEWGKGSNSGSILNTSLDNTQMLLCGYKEHDEQLNTLLNDDQQLTAVMWPGRGAINASEFVSYVKQQGYKNKPKIIVVDATWANARRMLKLYPTNIVKVQLDGTREHRSLLYPVRKYDPETEFENRVCTLEAVAYLLEEFGEDQQLIDDLLYNLKVNVDGVLLQKGLGQAYGTFHNNRK